MMFNCMFLFLVSPPSNNNSNPREKTSYHRRKLLCIDPVLHRTSKETVRILTQQQHNQTLFFQQSLRTKLKREFNSLKNTKKSLKLLRNISKTIK